MLDFIGGQRSGQAVQRTVQTFEDFVLANPDLRPLTHKPDSRLIEGRFYLEAAVATGAVTNVNLVLQQAWYHDARVRNAYSVQDSSTSVFRATLQLEAVGLLMTNGEYLGASLAVKDVLVQSDPFLEVGIGTATELIPLTEGIIDAFTPTATTVAATTTGIGRGAMHELEEPLRVDLENGTLAFKTLADVGSAYANSRVMIDGALVPPEFRVQSALPGHCPPRLAFSSIGAMQSIKARFRNRRALKQLR